MNAAGSGSTPSDPPVQFLDVSGGRVAYTDEGEGPVLVMVHGIPGRPQDFRWLAAALNEDFRVVRIGMPGFVGTDEALGTPALQERLGDFVARTLEALQLEDVTLVGHSMGGPSTLVASVLSPRVRRLVLLASAGLSPHRLYRRSRPDITARMLRVPGLRRVLRPVLELGFRASGFPAAIPDRERQRSIFVAGAYDFETMRGFASRVNVPVLQAWTKDDPMVEPAIGRALHEVLGSEFVEFERGGHNLQKSHAVALGERIRQFARETAVARQDSRS